MSESNIVAPEVEVSAKAETSSPESLSGQIANLQGELRKVRALQADLAERRTNLENSLTALLAEAGLRHKLNKLEATLSPAEKELLKGRKAVK